MQHDEDLFRSAGKDYANPYIGIEKTHFGIRITMNAIAALSIQQSIVTNRQLAFTTVGQNGDIEEVVVKVVC